MTGDAAEELAALRSLLVEALSPSCVVSPGAEELRRQFARRLASIEEPKPEAPTPELAPLELEE